MKITISGMPGAGKTTVAKILAGKLKLKHYYMGAIMRNLAKESGSNVDDFLKKAEKDPSIDKKIDDFLVKIGKEEDNFIAEGRTAAHFIPNAFKIFMAVDINEAARRIFEEKHSKGAGQARNEKDAIDVKQQAKNIKERIDSENLRYKKFYGIDQYDKKMYDLWVDTTHITPEQGVDMILKEIKKRTKV